MEGVDETVVGGIDLARIGVAPALRVGGDRYRRNDECIHQMMEQRVHGVLHDGVPLRSKVGVELADAHAAARISKCMPDDPAQCHDLRYAMALDHITKEHRVNIALQQCDGRRTVERPTSRSLGFRETTDDEILSEPLRDRAPSRCREPIRPAGRFFTAMPERLAEAEGVMVVGIARPRSELWTSLDSMRADETETTMSIDSASSSLRTNRSYPSTN